MTFAGDNYRNCRGINVEAHGVGPAGTRFHSAQGWSETFRSLKLAGYVAANRAVCLPGDTSVTYATVYHERGRDFGKRFFCSS